MKKELRVSKDLALPLDLVTQRVAILAMSGAGKSNTAVVLAEEMTAAGVPWIAIDPKGDWWGVRSSRDGKGAGLRVPVFGGEHGDVPLSAKSGHRMAELVASGKVTGVFDVSEFDSKADLVRFLTDFADTLLQRQRTPLHLFLEECDEYLPQVVSGEYARCVGAWKKLAKRGRFRGLGYTLISQRSAAVNKDALYQCGTLIAMRVFGKRDREAIKGWLEQSSEADAVVKTLPELEPGEAWVCSPQALKLMQRVRFRRRETYDSGRTPEIGEALVVPALAPIDLDALRAEMAAHDAPPEDDDDDLLLEQNRKLRARVAELEARPPAFDDRRAAAMHADLMGVFETHVAGLRGELNVMLNGYREQAAAPAAEARKEQRELAPGERVIAYGVGTDRAMVESGEIVRLPRQPVSPTTPPEVVNRDAKPAKSPSISAKDFSPEPPISARAGSKLGKGEVAVLTAIAQHRDGVTREQLTVLTGYKRSTRDLYLQKLRAGGFTEERGGRIHATAAGRLGLVTVEGVDYQITDIGFRMLEPYELLRAQFGAYASRYDLSHARTKKDQMRLIGNSVCPEVAEALVRANFADAESEAA